MLFRVANDHTVLPFVVVWPIMQLGNILAVPVCAAIAAATGRFRLCATILLGGALTYIRELGRSGSATRVRRDDKCLSW